VLQTAVRGSGRLAAGPGVQSAKSMANKTAGSDESAQRAQIAAPWPAGDAAARGAARPVRTFFLHPKKRPSRHAWAGRSSTVRRKRGTSSATCSPEGGGHYGGGRGGRRWAWQLRQRVGMLCMHFIMRHARHVSWMRCCCRAGAACSLHTEHGARCTGTGRVGKPCWRYARGGVIITLCPEGPLLQCVDASHPPAPRALGAQSQRRQRLRRPGSSAPAGAAQMYSARCSANAPFFAAAWQRQLAHCSLIRYSPAAGEISVAARHCFRGWHRLKAFSKQ
jgi:hypothetical protein